MPPGTSRAFVGGADVPEVEVAVRDGVALIPRLDRAGLYRVRWSEPHVGDARSWRRTWRAKPRATSGRARSHSAVGRAEPEVPDGAHAPAPRSSGAWQRPLAAPSRRWHWGSTWRGWRGARPRSPTVTFRAGSAALTALALLALGYLAALAAHAAPETYLRFEQPLALAVGSALARALAVRLARLPGGLAPRRRRAFASASSIAAMAAALAIAQPELGVPLDRLAVVAVVDRSRSMDRVPGLDARLTGELAAAERSMHPEDRVGRVVFGATAAIEDPLRVAGEPAPAQRVEVGRDATDLEAAIRRGVAELPPDAAGRLVLLTDGIATRGDTMAGTATALAAGVPVDVLPLEHPVAPDLRLVDVRAPARVDVGAPFELRVVTSSTVATDVELRVRSGEDAAMHVLRAHVSAGEDVLRVRELAKARPGCGATTSR